MYRKTCQTQELPEIDLYFAGRLNPENRWVKMADLVPWEEVESEYARHFKVSPQSPPCQKSGEQNFWSCFFAFECVRTDFSSLTGKR